MAIGVDTSKWKPRRLKGTPSLKVGNIIAFGLIGFGIISGAFLQFSKFTENLRNASENLYEDPISEVERRRLIAGNLPLMSVETMRQLIEEDSQPNRPDK